MPFLYVKTNNNFKGTIYSTSIFMYLFFFILNKQNYIKKFKNIIWFFNVSSRTFLFLCKKYISHFISNMEPI